jgi:hypothetical protein
MLQTTSTIHYATTTTTTSIVPVMLHTTSTIHYATITPSLTQQQQQQQQLDIKCINLHLTSSGPSYGSRKKKMFSPDGENKSLKQRLNLSRS